MKKAKSETFIRNANALLKVVQGCTSATCKFRKDDSTWVGTANLCDCGEKARGLSNQLDRELKTVDL